FLWVDGCGIDSRANSRNKPGALPFTFFVKGGRLGTKSASTASELNNETRSDPNKRRVAPPGLWFYFFLDSQGSATLHSFSSHFRTGSGLSCFRASGAAIVLWIYKVLSKSRISLLIFQLL